MANKSIDLKHHLSQSALRRQSVYETISYSRGNASPNLVNLDSGVPASEYFPFETLSSEFLKPDTFPLDPNISSVSQPSTKENDGFLGWLASFFTSSLSNKEDGATLDTLKIARYKQREGDFEVSTLMGYSPPAGLAPLETWVKDFVSKVYRPGYSDWATLVDIGAGDAFAKVLDVLASPGDGCFVDEWSYNHSLARMRSFKVTPFPVKIDAGGLDPGDLETILRNWDESKRGCSRPRLLLQVPVGQNPTGITLSAERKRAIYAIAVQYDLIIIEDDPYYFQQFGAYVRESTEVRALKYAKESNDREWIESLVPSFLRFDHQGRVVRFDTFSKTIGPGCRLGFFTASPLFRKHLMICQNNGTLQASGLSQALVGTLLKEWGFDGYVRWLRGLRGRYRLRRDWTIDFLHERFNIKQSSIFVAYKYKKLVVDEKHLHVVDHHDEKEDHGGGTNPLFEFVPATSGMFLWLKVYYHHLVETRSPSEARTFLSDRLWKGLLDSGVLFRPGFVFQGRSEEERDQVDDTFAFLRMCYAMATHDELKKGVERFSKFIVEFFD
ncbi:PLP-dependent transferase [Cantharellus anzutake]|uniref:PLP-dependent transferase n=1 Tax=Cantharellus anzutake TaxID=1750568 RepID=UPI001907657C|nr:PLP-dependent transferase [Cantharellus anzutake]KAF8344324.1 PLP-dependent transferase [Cantharellus anzutake]